MQTKSAKIHLDFAPMVDLGFLLITFFMLTTALSKPNVMAVVMPETDTSNPKAIKNSKVLTLLLGDNHMVYWYESITNPELDSTTFDANGLRRVIARKKEEVHKMFGNEHYADLHTGEMKEGSHLTVLIKPMPESKYKDLVDVLDEMAINQIRHYMILEPSEADPVPAASAADVGD